MIKTMNDRMGFGQYKDQLVSTVIREDPEYVDWASATIEWFNLDEEALAELDREMAQELL